MAQTPASMTAAAATGTIDKTKQRVVFSVVILIGALLVTFLIFDGDKKKKPISNATSPATTSHLTTQGSVSQYQDNLAGSLATQAALAAGSPNAAAFSGTPTGSPNSAAYSATQAPFPAQSSDEAFPVPFAGRPAQSALPSQTPLGSGYSVASPGAAGAPGYGRPKATAPVATPFPTNGPTDKPFYMDPQQRTAYAYGANASQAQHPLDREDDDLERDHKKRLYMGRYVSNIAQSRRDQKTATTDASTAGSTIPVPGINTAQVTAAPLQSQQPSQALPFESATSPGQATTTEAEIRGQRLANMADRSSGTATGATPTALKHPQRQPGTYLIPEGTAVDCVLQNRLNGDFAGPVKVMVSEPLYDRARERILIPAGSIFLGEAHATAKLGQERLVVSFHRLQRTDGYTADLDQFVGLDSVGETALKDLVNHHYVQVFGVALALGGISGYTSSTTNAGYNQTGTDQFKQGFSQSLDQSAMRIIDKYTNILPTITIREGHRVKVYFTNDFYIPDSIPNPVLD
jgi:type IV secretory pathway VirB10-like protein